MIKTNLWLYSETPARAADRFVEQACEVGHGRPLGGQGPHLLGEAVAFINPLSHPVKGRGGGGLLV